MKTLHELFLHELGDIYDAEQQLTKALPQVVQETTDPQIRQRVERHLRETEQHVKNIEACFQALGEKAKAEKCVGMAGILQEKQMAMKEKPSEEVLQAVNLSGSAKIEHYEIATYTSLIGLSRVMGHTECSRLLEENLRQEKEMALFIDQTAPMALEKLGSKTGDLNMASQGQGQRERAVAR